MRSIRYTLVTDGPSDQILLHVLDWVFSECGQSAQGQWFDPRPLRDPPRGLEEGIALAIKAYPCDVLFVHRDAEQRHAAGCRRDEIEEVARRMGLPVQYVCVVPVRMTEAWFLFDEQAVRRAAGNPGGKEPLGLPTPARSESEPDPKATLHHALCAASGLPPRRLERFSVAKARRRLAELLKDFSPLRTLSAFQHFEADVKRFLEDRGCP